LSGIEYAFSSHLPRTGAKVPECTASASIDSLALTYRSRELSQFPMS
jgi:hypothetical protein